MLQSADSISSGETGGFGYVTLARIAEQLGERHTCHVIAAYNIRQLYVATDWYLRVVF